ncbi:MAG: phosphopantetheine-binding protein, partial [Myxococcota bacterium]|nr:phosphopantetheine-binding protein [Myxococcota bacterium]
ERQAALRHALASDAAVEAFVRGLGSRRSRIVVSSFDPVRAAELAISNAKTQGAAAAAVRKRPEATTESRAPGSETARRLGEIWCELLGVDRVGARDDFFELGGHSLLATRVLARVDQAFGARLSLRDVFDAPTLERLSERIDAAIAKFSAMPAVDEADREELEF